MNIKNSIANVINLGILMSVLIFGIALTSIKANADDTNVQYPVVELGNCQNKDACKAYCDKSDNMAVCVAFAEKNNLMSSEEINMAKKFLNAGGKGPGGCTSKDSCEVYCDDINHINECVAYAEKMDILSPQDLAEAKQVQAAIARGVKPPPCNGKKACDAYCNEPDNMKICISFATEAGFIKGKELEDVQKMMSAIDKGVKPLPCRGKEACDIYCSQSENMETCINFSVAAGFMSKEEADMAKKTGGKGPGGCSGKEECDAFCNKQENQETCFKFGKDNGMIPPDQLKQIEEGNKKFYESINNASPEVKTCLTSEFGDLSKISSSRENGERARKCFEQSMKPENFGNPINSGGQSAPGNPSDVGGGPGGCKNPEECQTYCQTHQEECKSFGPGPAQPGQMQPGVPQQGQETQPNQNPGSFAPQEDMLLNSTLPVNQTTPVGDTPLPPTSPAPGSYPQTEPGSLTPPPPSQSSNSNIIIKTLSQIIIKTVAGVFFSLNPRIF